MSELFTIQESRGLFAVILNRPFQLRTGRSIPAGTRLGLINERGTISVWRSGRQHGYTEAARILLEAARSDLKDAGRIMARARAREASEEARTGSFVVLLSGASLGKRFYDFKRARAWAERELLDKPIGSTAKFFRASETRGPEGRLQGIPWTEPFHVEETYEWNGQKRVGMPGPNTEMKRTDPRRRSRARASASRSGRGRR